MKLEESNGYVVPLGGVLSNRRRVFTTNIESWRYRTSLPMFPTLISAIKASVLFERVEMAEVSKWIVY
jgi:hypothetical protein